MLNVLQETWIPRPTTHGSDCLGIECNMMTEAEADSLARVIDAEPGFHVNHFIRYHRYDTLRKWLLHVHYQSNIPNKVNVLQSANIANADDWTTMHPALIANAEAAAYDIPASWPRGGEPMSDQKDEAGHDAEM